MAVSAGGSLHDTNTDQSAWTSSVGNSLHAAVASPSSATSYLYSRGTVTSSVHSTAVLDSESPVDDVARTHHQTADFGFRAAELHRFSSPVVATARLSPYSHDTDCQSVNSTTTSSSNVIVTQPR